MIDREVQGVISSAEALETALNKNTRVLAAVLHWKARLVLAIRIGIAAIVVALIAVFGAIWTVHTTQIKACHTGNELRVKQVQLWDHVVDVSNKNPDQTPQQRQNAEEFRNYVRNTFKPINCTALYKLIP